MNEIDITKLSYEQLNDIVRVHSPTSHLRTEALDELERRHKLSESDKTTEILKLSKRTFIVVIIGTIATIIGLIITIFELFGKR